MKNKPFIKIGVFGILMLLFGLVLMGVFPKNAPYMSKGFKTPVIFFEFAENIPETQQLFGINAGQHMPNTQLIRQMNLGNKIDFIYAFLYASFLFLFAKKTYQLSGKKIFLGVMILSIFAFLSDISENINLLQITSKISAGDFKKELYLLHIFTWVKWGSLAMSFALLSKWFYDQKSWQRVIAPIFLSPVILAIFSYLSRGINNEYFSLSIMLSFMILWSYCFIFKTTQKTDVSH